MDVLERISYLPQLAFDFDAEQKNEKIKEKRTTWR